MLRWCEAVPASLAAPAWQGRHRLPSAEPASEPDSEVYEARQYLARRRVSSRMLGDEDPRLGGCGVALPVLGQSAASSEPGEGAFDHPAARDHLEAFGGIGALDDLDRPLAGPAQGGAQLRAGVAAIGVDMAQPGPAGADGPQHPGRSVASCTPA